MAARVHTTFRDCIGFSQGFCAHVQTTFRVGLALLKGVEKELLSADFEQVSAFHLYVLIIVILISEKDVPGNVGTTNVQCTGHSRLCSTEASVSATRCGRFWPLVITTMLLFKGAAHQQRGRG